MPVADLQFLGDRIRDSRKDCGLTQQELAEQAGLSIKTVQDIEAGKKNATYETLAALITRLGITANSIFRVDEPIDEALIQRLIGKIQSCSVEDQKFLLKAFGFLAEQLIARQHRDSKNTSD